MGVGGNPWLVAMSFLVFGGKSRFLNPSWRRKSADFSKEVSKASKKGDDAFNARVVLWGKTESWEYRII